MLLVTGSLQVAEAFLHGHQAARRDDVAGDEDTQAELHLIDNSAVHLGEFVPTLFGKGELVLDPLLRDLQQGIVDDIADMLQVGGEGDQLDATVTVLFVELVAAHPCEIELDRLVQCVDVVVEFGKPRDLLPIFGPTACK